MKQLRYLPGILLLILFVVISIFIYQDYGVSWDEPAQREMGVVSHNYIFHGDATLNHYLERDHGVGFELPLIFIEKRLHLKDTREIYLMRHIVSHLFFLIGCFCAYALTLHMFKKPWLACFAFLMLAMHPRLYAHSYFNSKDVPLLVMFMVSLLAAQVSFRKKHVGWALLLGIAVGYATSIRLLGIVLCVGIAFFFITDIVIAVTRKERALLPLNRLLVFLLGFCVTLYVAWPTLWEHPFRSFAECYESLSYFRWEYNVLFRGKMILASLLPATYLPIWIGISTPVIWLISGIAGILIALYYYVRQPISYLSDETGRMVLLCLYCAVVPISVVIIKDSIVYDDWRHLYFIYSSLVILAVLAVNEFSKTRLKLIVPVAFLLQTVITAYDLVTLHPFEQVYFNRLVARKPEFLRLNYELDYWAAGYKQAYEYLIAHAPEQELKISWGSPTLGYNKDILQAQDRERIVFVSPEDAQYIITNFRDHPYDSEYPYPQIAYEIKRMNSTVIRIYKK